MINVLFVCLGNICRSPMAEGLFIHHVKQAGLEGEISVDSCGTGGWHVGEQPDARMQATARRHGVELPSRARKLAEGDFREFDYILPMDRSNLTDVQEVMQNVMDSKAKVILMRQFDELHKGSEVPDPYWGGEQGFEQVYEILDRSAQNLLVFIREQHGL